jgi:deoxyribodipyrimidine photo-lyase
MPEISPKEINRDLLVNKSTGLSEELSKGKKDPREILKDINHSLESSKVGLSGDEEDYLKEIHRQLAFREFARSAIEQQSYRQPPGARGWDDKEFEKLRKGQTGIPVIDAAVKEMATTGKPHNRARLLLTRYAVRNLNIDPEEVSRWYKKSFKDYDPIITTFNVVQASSGAPFGEPYFRKSNPITAAKKLDPGGKYREK